MVWFKVDDTTPDKREVRRLREDRLNAMGLWTLAGAWASHNLTDGFVPAEIIAERWDPTERYAKALCQVGMWVESEQDGERGYQYIDWHIDQRTRVEVEKERADKREAGRLGGIASGAARRGRAASTSRRPDSPAPRRGKPDATTEAPASTEANHVVEADASAPAEAGGRTPTRPSRPSQPSSPLLAASATPTRVVAEALGLPEDDDETTKIVDFVRDNLKPTAMGPYLRKLAENGDLADIQRQLRTTATAPVDERVYSGPTHDFDPDQAGLSCTRCDMPRKHAAHRHLRPVEATG